MNAPTVKIELYVDVYPWRDSYSANEVYVQAYTGRPPEKPNVARRYKVIFTVPDPREPDACVEASAVETT